MGCAKFGTLRAASRREISSDSDAESETIQHTLFECTAFGEEREVFLSRLYSVCPIARQMNDEYRCWLVMGDRLPREIENSFYRYLSHGAISKLRLGILTEQEEGS